jgi:hypothetical protein
VRREERKFKSAEKKYEKSVCPRRVNKEGERMHKNTFVCIVAREPWLPPTLRERDNSARGGRGRKG